MNKNSNYGRALLNAIYANIGPVFGRVMVVLNSSDTADYNYQNLQDLFSGDSDIEGGSGIYFYTSVESALAQTQSNNDDVIVLGGHTSNKTTAMLTVSNSRVHFVGMGGHGRLMGSRAQISNTSAGADTDVSMVKITGTGVSFHDIKFANTWTNANNLYCVSDQGANTYFENCDIENLGSAHLTNASAASLDACGSESIFENCTIGVHSLKHTVAAGQEVLIGASKASGSMMFRHCRFQAWTSQTDHVFIHAGASAINSSVIDIEDCIFQNRGSVASGGATMAVAISTNASPGGRILVSYPRVDFSCSAVATSAVGATGVCVVAPVASGTASDIIAHQAA
jgi:hypothetical protein